MKIGSKLMLAVYIPALMALVIIVALAGSYQETIKIQESGDIVRQIRSSITELNHFVFSYTLYPEERPKLQFLAEHEKLTGLIAKAHLSNPDQRRLLERISQNNEIMREIFRQLVSTSEQNGTAETLNQLSSQLILVSYEADINAALLRKLVDDGIKVNEQRTIALIVFLILVATIPLTIVLVRTRRGITNSLSSLSEGVTIIGSGNLDYAIEEKGSDEITVLSRAFNQMTTSLKSVTASKVDLEKEITERKQAEEEVSKLNEILKRHTIEVEALNKELESFAYSVSHDLRAPLRSMQGFSQALLEDFSDVLNDEGKDYLRRVQGSAELMAQLIDDILQLSRIIRIDMQFRAINLSELVQAIAADLKRTQPQRLVEFVITPGLMAQGDEKLIRIALNNLLENAWKFTGKSNAARIEFGVTECDGQKTYFVGDNGVGFDMAYVGKMFKPFQRLHTTTEFPGNGIGLASVQRAILRHGGKVWAEGKVGKGATFYFTLG